MTHPSRPVPPADEPRVSPALVGLAAIAFVVATVAVFIFREKVYEFSLNPQLPFQTAPRAAIPDYARPESWAAFGALYGRTPHPDDAPDRTRADVFFVHGTTYASPKSWNAAIDHAAAAHVDRAVIPNEARPFAARARLFAPRYRQATLYAFRTRNEDSRRARSLAYQDVRRAFITFIERHNQDRPFLLAGIGQGGLHVVGLLQDEIAGTPAESRMIAAYVLAHPVPLDLFDGPLASFPVCDRPERTGCVASWTAYPDGLHARMATDRSTVWDSQALTFVNDRPILCTEPAPLPPGADLGCRDGILRIRVTSAQQRTTVPYPRRPFHALTVHHFRDAIAADTARRIERFFRERGGEPPDMG